MPSSAAQIYSESLPPRTLADVRDQVSQSIAVRIVKQAEVLDGNKFPKVPIEDVKYGVLFTFSKSDDVGFLKQIAQAIKQCCFQDYLFAIATTGDPVDSEANFVFLHGSTEELVQRAVLLSTAKFIGRVTGVTVVQTEPAYCSILSVKDVGYTSYDEAALWDVVKKSAQPPIDPLIPPPGSRSIDKILSDVRAQLQRLKPTEAYDELREPAAGPAPTFLVDIRNAAQRDEEGGINGALVVDRNALEWKFDPRSLSRLTIADRYDLRIIVFCQEGDSSSLAAYSLQKLGLLNATDIIGGFRGWRDAGLPDVFIFLVGSGSERAKPLLSGESVW
ncbi:hypothetical protein BDP27DRAFT_1382111 [Rhodocollybia butyracea]|uniref:Rhodanese domain-containing protein n=1 Tax=Rhodocollybia butyracea TaxID=206335 RepID=A0A9P5UAU3_9AGAR|nr:hypothetical protein BDP27DRAFT_1382111 [Rhodocollybia butyracea]